MTSEELRWRAAAIGVSVNFWDWRGREVTVPDETLAAILEALGDPPPPAPADTSGAAAVAPAPERRLWGFTVQLYSLR